MKKVFTTILLTFSFGLILNAQKLATFEDGANDPMTIDATYWIDPARFIEGGTPAIASNPDKGGLNKSDKCFQVINVADADWWGNFIGFNLSSPITITESNRYLRFMAYRSIQPKNFRVGINGRDGAEAVFEGKLKADGTWEGVVADLGPKFMGKEITNIQIIFSTNWSDPRSGWGVATYMFDDFELSDSPIPPGVTVMDGTGLSVGFESQAEITKWVNTFDVLNAANTSAQIDNPFTTSAVNSGGKVLQFNKSDQASWWQGFRTDFNGIMPVGGTMPSYIHVMVYIPASVITGDMMGVDVQLCAKDHMGNENNEVFTIWDDQVDEWIDLVMEVDKIDYLKELTVRYDVRKNAQDEYINSPANTFYLDAIAFDNNPEPRTKIITGINKISSAALADITVAPGTIEINTGKTVNIQVYDVLGKLVKSQNSNGSAAISVGNGVYIVKIATVEGEKQITKVLVK